jgi:DNA-binding XRE family transcriptional regulator
MNAIPAFGETFEVIESRGERSIAVIPARIWKKLPAELRNHPVEMLRDSKARLVPLDLFRKKYLEAIEDELDAEAAAAAADAFERDKAARRRAGAEPAIPFEVVQSEVAGAHPIAAWRKYRDMTQARLASEIGIDRGYLAQIERGGRAGTPETLAKIARALGCLVEDLLE